MAAVVAIEWAAAWSTGENRGVDHFDTDLSSGRWMSGWFLFAEPAGRLSLLHEGWTIHYGGPYVTESAYREHPNWHAYRLRRRANLFWFRDAPNARGIRVGRFGVGSTRWPEVVNAPSSMTTTWVMVPTWLALVVLAAWPIALAIAARHRWWRPAIPGRCRRCGYDLRASPDRCPECGAAAADRKARTRAG